METRTYNVFTFDELSKEGKAKALENYRDINVDDPYWYEHIYSEWNDKLQALGYSNVKISFSGFASQGDGACFDANIDTVEWLKAHKLLKKFRRIAAQYETDETPVFRIRKNSYASHYSHYNTRSVEADDYGEQKDVGELCALMEEERKALSKQLYKELEEEYWYQTGDDQIIETLKANDYNFTEDGEID